MSQDLVKRAEDIRARYKVLESVKGSGYHDEDRNPARADQYLAPQKNVDPARPGKLLPRASEHIVAFFDHVVYDEVHFVGPDAERAFETLKTWYSRNAKRDPVSMPGTERKLVLKLIPNLKLATVDEIPRLTIRLCDWNDVLTALYAEGVGISGAPLVSDDE